jgi:hypothetical protein
MLDHCRRRGTTTAANNIVEKMLGTLLTED